MWQLFTRFRGSNIYSRNINKSRKCKTTAYARQQGAYVSNDCCYWWLRSPGGDQLDAADVCTDGALDLFGRNVYGGNFAVRPALRIICNQ
ncbi:DUF6273 domain-containing protein [Ruminobacter sp.]|uniref:DUF6273 domain-containing protein n=1 Tax=Ruminobacter sp. TaxID=2774296 RepID=UPI00338ECC1C